MRRMGSLLEAEEGEDSEEERRGKAAIYSVSVNNVVSKFLRAIGR